MANEKISATTLLAILILVLALVATYLIVAFQPDSVARRGTLVPPSRETLVSIISTLHPEWEDVKIRDSVNPRPEPNSDVLGTYSVYNRNQLICRLAIVRQDIACSTCTDQMLAVLFDPTENQVIDIISLEPQNLHDPSEVPTQFIGRSLKESLFVRGTLTQMRVFEDRINSKTIPKRRAKTIKRRD